MQQGTRAMTTTSMKADKKAIHEEEHELNMSVRSELSEAGVSLRERVISSTLGALVTSLVVTPLDVVKTRLQASVSVHATHAAATPAQWAGNTGHNVAVRGLSSTCGPACYEGVVSGCMHSAEVVTITRRGGEGILSSAMSSASPAAASVSAAGAYGRSSTGGGGRSSIAGGGRSSGGVAAGLPRNLWMAMAQIARVEGMTSLYAGLTPTLLMAVPNTVLYFTCYDELKKRMLKEKLVKTETMAHGLAGAMARTVAVIAVAPVEFVRTRLQAGLGGGVLGTMGAAVREVGGGGIWALYRGVLPTLLRDVPFSALYFIGYERLKRAFDAVLQISSSSSSSSSSRYGSRRCGCSSQMYGLLTAVLSVSLITGLDIALTNTSFVYLDASLVEVLKPANVLFVLLFGLFLGLRTLSSKTMFSVALIVLGQLLITSHARELDLKGIDIVLLAVLMSAAKIVLLEVLLHGGGATKIFKLARKLDAVETVAFTMPGAGIVLLAATNVPYKDENRLCTDYPAWCTAPPPPPGNADDAVGGGAQQTSGTRYVSEMDVLTQVAQPGDVGKLLTLVSAGAALAFALNGAYCFV